MYWRLSLAAVALALATGGGAQQTPVFRTAVDRVRVDVVVTDRDDRPIADLTKADFAIVENGRAQTITDFRFVSVPLERRELAPGGHTAPPSDVATNAPASELSRLWAIMVDDLHLIEADIIPIKRVLTDLVRALPPQDEVAIVYTGRSNISVNFTSDPGRLFAAIEKVREAVGFGLDADPKDRMYANRQAELTAEAIRGVARSLSGSGHPRRAIVYVGTMTTINTEELAGIRYIDVWLRPAFEEAHRSNVPVYTIDPRGTVVPEDAVRGGIGAIATEGIRRRIAANIRFQQEWLRIVATNTGGRAFVNSSDLTRAVHEIVADNGSFYELAYAPDPLPRDGKFHDIEVEVNRPGVRVRARKGYVAPGARPDAPSLQEQAETSMASGVNVAGLTLRAVATPLAASGDRMQTAITVALAYPLVPGTRRIDDTLALSIYALDPDARVKAQSIRQLRVSGNAPPLDSVALLLDDAIALPSGTLTIRIGVASQQLGRAGTVQLPLEVPDPAAGDVQLSGVAIGRGDRPAPALNAAAIAEVVPFQPATERTFAPTDALRLFGRVYWRGPARPDVTIEIDSSPPRRIEAALGDVRTLRGRNEAAYDAVVPLAGLVIGDRVLTVRARLGDRSSAPRQLTIAVR